MTFKIKLSGLGMSAEAFASRVQAHCERLVEYYHHLDGVRIDAQNIDLKPEQRRVAFPPPTDEQAVEWAIRRDQREDGGITPVIDYEIEGPTLAEKKEVLVGRVREQEAALIREALPPAKARYWQLREQDIRAADHMRIANHPTRVDDPAAFLAACRPTDDTRFLADYEARKGNVKAIQRWGAKLEYDIDDLTDETVDQFAVTPFNG